MPKQGNNIYKRKDGRWEGRYVKSRKEGKIQYGYVFAKTYEEVEQKLILKRNLLNEGTFNKPDQFKKISFEWLNSKTPQLKASSIVKYRNILNTYLIPEFGEMCITEITRNSVSEYSRNLLTSGGTQAKGLSPKTVNCILSVIKNIFEHASREYGLVPADIKNIYVKQVSKPLRILSLSEQKRLSSYLLNSDKSSDLGILICLYTGLRLGEICALKWEDICLKEQYISVHKTMQRIQKINPHQTGSTQKTEVLIFSPKSICSIRKIPIPSELNSILKKMKKDNDTFVLTGKSDVFIEPRTMENRFKTVTKQCSIDVIHFHSLRHTFATRCVELGFDIKSLSEILGHASVNITLNRYVHPSMKLKQKNMNKLSGLFVDNKPSKKQT